MTITSYDSILAAQVAGRGQERHFSKTLSTNAAGQGVSLWESAGMPAAGGGGSSLVTRNCDPSTTGALSFDNASGDYLLHLINGYAVGSASAIGTLVLYDRIADVSGISLITTAVQNITSSAWARYADGEGVMAFLELTQTCNGAPVLTMNYTDQDGNAGTTPNISCGAFATPRFAYTGHIYMPLAAGDTGIRAITSITLSDVGGSSTGIARLVLAKQLAAFPMLTAGTVIERDFVTQTPRLPTIEDDHCLAFFTVGAGTATGTINGMLNAISG